MGRRSGGRRGWGRGESDKGEWWRERVHTGVRAGRGKLHFVNCFLCLCVRDKRTMAGSFT